MKSYVIIAGRAWELIRLAKDKYAKSGNMVGVGRCENNMGNFCIHEKQRQEAIQHFKNALEIKEDLNDVPGVLNQLANWHARALNIFLR